MKKIIVLLIVSIILVSGCSKKENITEIDMKEVGNIIEKKLNNMETVSDNEITKIYGLDTTNIEEYIIKENKDGDLYAIIKTKDVDEAKTAMDDYFKKVKEFHQSYSPKRLKILENRVEREIGNYLIYIVSEDAEDIYEDIVKAL